MSSNPITPKSAGKAPVKSVAPTESQSKRGSKRRRATAATGLQFRSAIKKCLKEISPDGSVKITEKTLSVLCGIANSLIEDIINCASELTKKVDKETIGVDDLTTSFELLLTGELKNTCVKEIKSTVAKAQTRKIDKR